MKKIQKELITLKINVRDVKKILLASNKKIKKIKLNSNRIAKRNLEEDKRTKKERTIEKASKISSLALMPIMAINNRLGLFGDIKKFIELIITGIIVNNLPSIIKTISKFFDNNKWIIDGITFVISILGKGISSIINIVDNISKNKQDKTAKNLETINDQFKSLDKSLDNDNREIDRAILSLSKEKPKEENKDDDQEINSIQKTKIKSENIQKSDTTKNNTEKSNQTLVEPKQTKGIEVDKIAMNIPKYAKGGKVEASVSKSKPDSKKSMVSNNLSFSTNSSVKSKKAVQTVNYFSFFNENTETSKNITLKDIQNTENFKDILKTLKKIQDLKSGMVDETSTLDRSGSFGDTFHPGEPIDVDQDEVIGTVGHTGRVVPAGPDGTHIHIENVSNYSKGIPDSVKNNILISGIPMPKRLRFTSGIGPRWGRTHKGEDYAGEPDQPITLTGGLKFVGFNPASSTGGYGNQVIIQAPDGTQYSLSHLNSGPKNLQALRTKQNKKRIAKTPKDLASAFNKIRIVAQSVGSPNPDLTAAIAMLESGWLSNPNSVYAKSRGTNPFGQTGKGTKGYVIGADGQKHAVYGSLDEGVKTHINLWKNYYKGNSPREILENLRRAGYNKFPSWTNKVMRIYNQMYSTSRSPVSSVSKSTNLASLVDFDTDNENTVVVNRTVVIRDTKLVPFPMAIG